MQMSCTPPTVSDPKFGKILQLRCFLVVLHCRIEILPQQYSCWLVMYILTQGQSTGKLFTPVVTVKTQQHVGWSCSGVGCETCNVWYHIECVSITHSHYLALNNLAHVWICFQCQTVPDPKL